MIKSSPPKKKVNTRIQSAEYDVISSEYESDDDDHKAHKKLFGSIKDFRSKDLNMTTQTAYTRKASNKLVNQTHNRHVRKESRIIKEIDQEIDLVLDISSIPVS